MAISNVSSGLRPGVCTSTTRPQAPFEGQLIYETDTNRVLVWDNAAWVMIADTNQPPGLQLVKTQTIGTAVSSVTVTGAFSADYDNYKIIISGGAHSTNADLRLQVGASVTGYYAGYSRVDFIGAAVVGRSDNNGVRFQACGTTSANGHAANFDLNMPFLSAFTYFSAPVLFPQTNDSGGFGSGFLNNTTSHTAFTITTSTGTITGGTIRVYGYRN
jgi:hypothetical protein